LIEVNDLIEQKLTTPQLQKLVAIAYGAVDRISSIAAVKASLEEGKLTEDLIRSV
jgi:hypothetical protein